MKMKITVKIKLSPSSDQKASLLKTFTAFNQAANFAARNGFDKHVFSLMSIHRLSYYGIRAKFALSAQLTVRAIGKAVEQFKRDKKKCPVFKDRSAIVYDGRIMRFVGLTHVNLDSVDGRMTIPMIVSGYQDAKLQAAIKVGQADLVYIKGTFYLLVSVEMENAPKIDNEQVIGVDFGVQNIAVDSEGNVYSGTDIEENRKWTKQRRDVLQGVGTKSAKRRLKSLSGYEANYRKTANHQIARKIVDTAKGTNSVIAIENLKGIREKIRFCKNQRARMTGWSFHQLRSFIEYKAELAGVTVAVVDPRNTSRTCSVCGNCDKANRKSQSVFLCRQCGYADNADFNAAKNIRGKGYISCPMVEVREAKAGVVRNCG
jgi:IS605 OrfB family transposase